MLFKLFSNLKVYIYSLVIANKRMFINLRYHASINRANYFCLFKDPSLTSLLI